MRCAVTSSISLGKEGRKQKSEDEKIEVGDQKTEVTGLRTGKDRDQKSEKNNGMEDG